VQFPPTAAAAALASKGSAALHSVKRSLTISTQEKAVLSYPETLGALKRSPYGVPDRALRSVKDEMRQNLLARLCQGGPLFAGVIGYEETVMPQMINAILSRHNFILLGLRGQAKSRILRALVTLLDDAIPIVAGSEVNDNPFQPISKFARNLINEAGDDTPIAWVGQESRYVEKLATPDVTIADLIGDLDPIKAARGGHLLSDELTIHYGMLPRANSCPTSPARCRWGCST
jgi:magnesium chelatase subunit I